MREREGERERQLAKQQPQQSDGKMAAEWALPASASAPAAAAQARCDACGRYGGWQRGRHNGKLVGGFMQHAHTDRGAHTHTH